MIFVQSGALHIGEEAAEWTIEPGQMLLLRPDAWHYSVRACELETCFYWLHIQTAGNWRETESSELANMDNGDGYASSPYLFQLPKYRAIPHAETVFVMLENLLEASSKPQSSAFWQQQTTFMQLMQTLDMRRFTNRTYQAVTLAEQTEAYLKNNFRSQITNETLSAALHFHHNYIIRCMKQVYGMTPLEYLNRYRLEQAKLLLLRTDWPIAHIAEQVGFDLAAYFTRRFTDHVGLSPRQYRMRYTHKE